jgi:hypothetical protein
MGIKEVVVEGTHKYIGDAQIWDFMSAFGGKKSQSAFDARGTHRKRNAGSEFRADGEKPEIAGSGAQFQARVAQGMSERQNVQGR